MKYILLLGLIYITLPSVANEEVLELNAENLTLLALKNSSQEAIDEYVLYLVKSTKTKEYFKAMRDKDKLDALLKQEKDNLATKLSKINKLGRYKLKKTFTYKSYNEATSTLNLGQIISNNVVDIFRAYDDLHYLPSAFLLLIPNAEIMQKVQVNKKRFNHLLNYWKKNSQDYNKSLYLEIVFKIEKYQNNNDFQATIERFDIYSSKHKKALLASKVETRKHSDLITNWLLSGGFSNPLIGIHAFSFFGLRLQDQLVVHESLNEICKINKKVGIHQTIICEQPYTKNTEIIVSYLGGRIARIDVVSINPLSKFEINKIKQDIKRFLKVSDLEFKFNYSFIQWSSYGVDFKLFSASFLNKQSEDSNYKNMFKANSSPKKRTLVLTMMAEESKKLLTKLGVKL